MSKRSDEKRITQASRTLKFLREQTRLSLRKVEVKSGYPYTVINHLEHGRMDIKDHHLKALLPIYGVTPQTFEMFASGAVPLPQNLRFECLEIVRDMSETQLGTIYPVLVSVAARK